MSPPERIARQAHAARLVVDAVRAHPSRPLAVTRRAGALRRRGFSVAEIEAFGLLGPGVSDAEIAAMTSRRETYALLDRLNPKSLHPIADDKAIFWRVCAWTGVPTPPLHAIHHRGAPGWTDRGRAPRGAAEWLAVIRDDLPDEFVLKPAQGRLGQGVHVLRRDGSGFCEFDGARLDAAGVLAIMSGESEWTSWIVQERVRTHPDLHALSGTDAVQTVRVLSVLGRDGTARAIWADLRVVMGDSPVDNWRDGTTGNALATVDLETGRLRAAMGPGSGGRILTHDVHPRTGQRFDEVVLPGWAEGRWLVERSAPRFAPMRALGWDLVLGEDGPRVLEIQARWGPHNQTRGMPVIARALRAALA